MSDYQSDMSMEGSPLTPGLSESHSLQVSTLWPEPRSPSPGRPAKRRCHNNLPSPLHNGDTLTPTTAVHSGQAEEALTPRAPRSPRFFGDSREYLSLILSSGLTYNRSRGPRNLIMVSAGANRLSHVPWLSQLPDVDWRGRPGTWPRAARDEASGEETESVAVRKRINSSAW